MIPVCLRLLQELHEILMKGVRGDAERPGEFRNVQNFIGSSHDIRQARFVPPPVAEMRRCLEELEVYMNEAGDALPHLVRVALVHYQFETRKLSYSCEKTTGSVCSWGAPAQRSSPWSTVCSSSRLSVSRTPPSSWAASRLHQLRPT